MVIWLYQKVEQMRYIVKPNGGQLNIEKALNRKEQKKKRKRKANNQMREENKQKKLNLKHLVNIACTKNLMNTCKLLRFISWKIRRKNTILSTPPPEKLACSTWGSCTLFSTILLHSNESLSP